VCRTYATFDPRNCPRKTFKNGSTCVLHLYCKISHVGLARLRTNVDACKGGFRSPDATQLNKTVLLRRVGRSEYAYDPTQLNKTVFDSSEHFQFLVSFVESRRKHI